MWFNQCARPFRRTGPARGFVLEIGPQSMTQSKQGTTKMRSLDEREPEQSEMVMDQISKSHRRIELRAVLRRKFLLVYAYVFESHCNILSRHHTCEGGICHDFLVVQYRYVILIMCG